MMYPRDCGFFHNGTFFISDVSLRESDYYVGNSYANVPEIINQSLGIFTYKIRFKGGEFVSDGKIGIVSRPQEDLVDLERMLDMEVFGLDIAKHTDYFFNFIGENAVLYNQALARQLTNSIDGDPIVVHTDSMAEILDKKGYRLVEIERNIANVERYHSREFLLTHLLLLGNVVNINGKIVMIEDLDPFVLIDLGFESVPQKLRKQGFEVLEVPTKESYEMYRSKGGPRCMTFPLRIANDQ